MTFDTTSKTISTTTLESDRVRASHCDPSAPDSASHARNNLAVREQQTRNSIRGWIVLFLSLQSAWPCLLLAQSDENAPPQKVEKLIEDLGSDNFSKRELAMMQLNANKIGAVPLAIEAIDQASGEQADQLLQFLASVASNPYDECGKMAYQSLTKLSLARTSSKGSRATKILQVIGMAQRDEAKKRLQRLGVYIGSRQYQIGSMKKLVHDSMVIDQKFKGDATNLECLRWLSQIEFVRLVGPNIDRNTLLAVMSMPDLKQLQLVEAPLHSDDLRCLRDGPDLDLLEVLYVPIGDEAIELLRELPVTGNLYLFGTNISLAGKSRLLNEIDTADVFVSRGAFLGVECQPTSAIINDTPPGGAARAAGLKRNDKLLTINGAKIGIFEDLKRELANHAPGEEVLVEFERNKEKLSLMVVLGKRIELGP